MIADKVRELVNIGHERNYAEEYELMVAESAT